MNDHQENLDVSENDLPGDSELADQFAANQDTILMFEYYQRPLWLLQLEYSKSQTGTRYSHSIRSRFWQFVPTGNYEFLGAQGLIESYLSALEDNLKSMISDYSIGYWLHLFRRVYPGPIGPDPKPETVGLVRAVLEAAIQKFAKADRCSRIGLSKEVDVQEILGGLLMAPEFRLEKESLLSAPNQLVLTNFSLKELAELYDAERLAYEIWRSGATLRSTAKGAQFFVEDSATRFGDDRSDELNELVKIYDSRERPFSASAIGACFDSHKRDNVAEGIVLLPVYNLTGVKTDSLKDLFHYFKIDLQKDFCPNFIWSPFNLRAFREVHLPLAKEFQKVHNAQFDAVLSVIACLSSSVIYTWSKDSAENMIRHWQRAYEGPVKQEYVLSTIMSFLPMAAKLLGISEDHPSKGAIEEAIDFWTLTEPRKKNIDLVYSGPHYIFLPFENRLFIDYAWIYRRLYDLFYGVNIPDQNFKGLALEIALRQNPSVLPYGPCKSNTGEERQIDYACNVDDCLIIAECKVVSRSIAFDRGQPDAIQYRTEMVVNRCLAEADEKAKWLAQNPKGRNYDISCYKKILPVGVSPFVEFIPSMESKYWIQDKTPRLLTPNEFIELIETSKTIEAALNLVPLGGRYSGISSPEPPDKPGRVRGYVSITY